ncbi:MAG: condensation domain-containing protein, partial [Acidobacteriota bacterium]|nr:condensation domain-containing protein [Acidobacteriota bacterium]
MLAQLLREQSACAAAPASGRLSYGQKSLLYLYKRSPDSHAYNTRFLLRITSEIDRPALQACLDHLVERHAILRTAYPAAQPGTQVVVENVRYEVEPVDASQWDERELDARIEAESQRPFQLEQGSVLRACLFSRSNRDHLLLLCAHHIAVDYWSFIILFDELRALYPAFKLGQPSPLAPVGGSYIEFANRQHEYIESEAAAAALQFWREKLGGDPARAALPVDRPRPATQSYRGATSTFEIDGALAGELGSLAKREGATIYSVCLAAWLVLLSRYTAEDRVLIGAPAAGRDSSTLEKVAGYFVNLLPFVADCSGNPSFRDFLRQVSRTVLECLDHQVYPFALLVEKLGLERHLNRAPLFDVLFSWDKPHRAEIGSISG